MRAHPLKFLTLVVTLAMGLLLAAPPVTQAEDAQATEDLPNQFMIRGGWAYVFNADTTLTLNGAQILGTTVDFVRTLKGQREDSLWRIDTLYRFNPRHSVGFSYYDVRRKGTAPLNADITINNITYGAGGKIDSELNIGLYRFFYDYSFHHDEKVELAASAGLYFANISTMFSGNLTCTGAAVCGGAGIARSDNRTVVAPLPSVGLLANYNFTPRLQGQARFDWFYFEAGNFKGAMNEMYIGLEYRLYKHFAMGAAFDRFSLDVKSHPQSGNGWRLENDWNVLYFFGSLYF